MSYEIVKRIVFKKDEKEVWCSWDSNNVHPRNWTLRIWESGTRMLRERGREHLDRFIIYSYWSGNIQPGNRNRYSNTVDWFRRNRKEFTWDNVDIISRHLKSQIGEQKRAAHEKHLNKLHGKNITTNVDWTKPEFMDALYQAYVERKKIPVAKIGDKIEFETPVKFTSGMEKSRFELVRRGKKAVRFKDEHGLLYNIRRWRDLPYKIY